jgi:hypothetical protein
LKLSILLSYASKINGVRMFESPEIVGFRKLNPTYPIYKSREIKGINSIEIHFTTINGI